VVEGLRRKLHQIPFDPSSQWREQILSDNDLFGRRIANVETVQAHEKPAAHLVDEDAWQTV
jgi:hypothetical protein